MKTAGFLIFVVGIVIAISAGAKMPPDPEASSSGETGSVTEASSASTEAPSRFPDTLGAFAGGAILCGIGLTLWWKVVLEERRIARSAVGSAGSDSESNPATILQQLLERLNSTLGDLDSLVEADLQSRIEGVVDSHVTPLAEARHQIIDRFGMSKGSEILVATAYGERMLNRVWSAAADGYLEEAQSSFREATQAFDEAAAMLSTSSTSV